MMVFTMSYGQIPRCFKRYQNLMNLKTYYASDILENAFRQETDFGFDLIGDEKIIVPGLLISYKSELQTMLSLEARMGIIISCVKNKVMILWVC